MREYIPIPNCLTKNGDKLPKKGQNYPKISKMFWHKKIFVEFWAISILCTNLNFPFKLGLTDSPRSTKSWFLFCLGIVLNFFGVKPFTTEKMATTTKFVSGDFFICGVFFHMGKNPLFYLANPRLMGIHVTPLPKFTTVKWGPLVPSLCSVLIMILQISWENFRIKL